MSLRCDSVWVFLTAVALFRRYRTEYHRSYQPVWRTKNHDRFRASQRRYRLSHKDQINAYQRLRTMMGKSWRPPLPLCVDCRAPVKLIQPFHYEGLTLSRWSLVSKGRQMRFHLCPHCTGQHERARLLPLPRVTHDAIATDGIWWASVQVLARASRRHSVSMSTWLEHDGVEQLIKQNRRHQRWAPPRLTRYASRVSR